MSSTSGSLRAERGLPAAVLKSVPWPLHAGFAPRTPTAHTGPVTRVLIAGGGTMGLASAWALAQRGAEVTVVDPRRAPHDDGSHGGYTRAIRHAYHEGPQYVPLVREADRLWCSLEKAPGELLVRTGMVEMGSPDDADFDSAVEACEMHGIECHRLEPSQLHARFGLTVAADWRASWTPAAGYLRVGPCLERLRERAQRGGATFLTGPRVVALTERGVRLDDGRSLEADVVVVAVGSRATHLVPALPVVCQRRVLLWLEPPAGASPLPVWGAFAGHGFFYGFPPGDEGVDGLKVACHSSTEIRGFDDEIDPDHLDDSLRDEDRAAAEFARALIPGAGGVLTHRVCVYASTPDGHFIVDRHPERPNVVVAAGFSGHGFKFAPAIGRMIAGMCLDAAAPMPGFEFR